MKIQAINVGIELGPIAVLAGLLVFALMAPAAGAQDCEGVCRASHQLCLDDPRTRPGVCIAILRQCLDRCSVCSGVADGRPCPGVPDRAGDCVAPVCRGGACSALEPVSDDRSCTDVDPSDCRQARCRPRTGTCDQSARPRPDGTACGDDLPSFCGRGSCRAGACIASGAPGGPDPVDPAAVEVTARPQPVDKSEAFNDCCVFCSHQSLEALRPTPGGPEKLEPGGGLPLRTKFCGEVRRYAVNDERDDPRDILFDLAPVDGFEHFVAGILQTNCTKLEGRERQTFDVGPRPFRPPRRCPTDACLEAAASKEGKCIHAELTPAQQFYDEDARYLPISEDDSDCDDDSDCTSRLEVSGQTVCVYGVYAYDHGAHRVSTHDHSLCCVRERSHDHPEIHPFDAVWWRHDEHDGWIFGVFQDDSNRYSTPHCGSQNNDSRWSQAPRDLTFRFPFRFPRAEGPRIARLRHVVTSGLDRGVHSVVPLNVTTAAMPGPVPEVKQLTAAGETWLEVVEPAGFEEETQVRISGCVTATEVKGLITVRAAVGCAPGAACELERANPNGRHDRDDPGSGFLYDELIFERTALPQLTVRLRVPEGPGRFNLRIDGVTRAANAGDRASTGPQDVSVGPHTVSQTAGTGTRLSDYSTFFSGDCNAQGRVVLARGEEKTCSITNILLDDQTCEEQCAEDRNRCMRDLDENTPELCQALFRACLERCNP